MSAAHQDPRSTKPAGPAATAGVPPVGGLSVDDRIDAYLDGELDDASAVRLRAELKTDPARAAELAAMESAIAMLRRPVDSPDFVPGITGEVLFRSALADPLVFARRRNTWLLPASIAAGVLVALGAGVMFMNSGPRGPASPGPSGPGERPIAAAGHAPAEAVRPKAPDPEATGAPNRSTALRLGPTDQHGITGNWSTELKDKKDALGSDAQSARERAIADSSANTLPSGGRIVSLRVGPTWSLWWIPPDSGAKNTPSGEPWRLLTRLASPTNATVNKPSDEIDKVK